MATVIAPEATGLRDDFGLTGVLLRVEHLAGDLTISQQAAEFLGPADAGRADEDGLARLVAVGDVRR